MNRWIPACVAAVIVSCALAPRARADELVIVRDGASTASIVISREADEIAQEAARDLAAVLEEISGATLPVRESADGPALVIEPRDADADMHPLGYHVFREGETVYLSGGSWNGAANAVYAFLEHLGCRWYAPGEYGDYVPRHATVSLRELDISDEPDYVSVSGFGPNPADPAAGGEWLRRNMLVGFPHQYHSHNWEQIISHEEMEEHPEWFALHDGNRINQFCTTEPAVVERAIAAANEYFDSRPEAVMYSLSPNDGAKFCQCDRCRALDRELGVEDTASTTGSFTERLVYFCNQVAEGVAERHPDKHLAFYAYVTHTDPPKTVIPHRMLIPVVCHTPWDFCAHHPLDDPECARNAHFARIIEGWDEIAEQVYVYDYYGHYHWFGPYGLVHNLRRDIPWMREHGVVGLNSETHANWWTQGLNFWVAVNLVWDLDADVDSLVDDYNRGLFGPAAEPVGQYWQLFEDVMADVPYDRDHERSFVDDVTPELLDRGDEMLAEAERIVVASELPAWRKDDISVALAKVEAGHRFTKAQTALENIDRSPSVMALLGSGESVGELLDTFEADSLYADVVETGLARTMFEKAMREMRYYVGIWDDTRLEDEQREVVLQMLRDGRFAETAAALGFVTDWHVVGLFDAPGMRGLREQFSPEQGPVDLSAAYEGAAGQVAWRPFTVDNAYGVVDIRDLYRDQDTDGKAAYLYTEIEYVNGVRDVEIRLGSNDGAMLWHNEQLILASSTERPLTPDQDRVWAHLDSGTNRFLLKVHNTGNRFEATMRMLDFKGRPVSKRLEWY